VIMKNVNHVPHIEDLENLLPIVFKFLGK
jgi:hypothetical protein